MQSLTKARQTKIFIIIYEYFRITHAEAWGDENSIKWWKKSDINFRLPDSNDYEPERDWRAKKKVKWSASEGDKKMNNIKLYVN